MKNLLFFLPLFVVEGIMVWFLFELKKVQYDPSLRNWMCLTLLIFNLMFLTIGPAVLGLIKIIR